MCAIYGFVSQPAIAENYKAIVQKINNCMATRGPDDRGHILFNNHKLDRFLILMGHLRLSIIDTSPASRQPMQIDNENLTITYNGEIYNYIELRETLKSKGHHFKTSGDTEVLLRAYKEWDSECLLHLEGMFAFAILNKKKNILFCARDYFGIKPFYYHKGERGFYFASDTSAMLQFPEITREPDLQTSYDYLWCGRTRPGSETFYKNIQKLPPAHYLEIDTKSYQIKKTKCYWKPHLKQTQNISFPSASEKLRDLFAGSVKRHLRSDVTLGCALSGGIDSSAIACMIRYLEPEMPISTFSYVAEENSINEKHWAELVANTIKASAFYIKASSHELREDLDSLILAQGEPFSTTSVYAQYRVFSAFRENGVVVSLDGQGADELLGGYTGYSGARIASLILKGRIDKAIAYLHFASKTGVTGRSPKGMLLETIGELIPHYLKPLGTKILWNQSTASWLEKKPFQYIQQGGGANIGNYYQSSDRLRRALAYALTTKGLDQLLNYEDKNSMAFSIESRVPFLTKELAEFTLSLPENYLVDNNGVTKSIFRSAMRGIVPDAILDRQDKIGFATPEQKWLKELSPWISGLFADITHSNYIDVEKARMDWLSMQSGKTPFSWRIWRCLNFLRWQQLFNIK